jgi:hypothetical protein
MVKFYTRCYAVMADVALLTIACLGVPLSFFSSAPGWALVFLACTVCFALYANVLMLTGRSFSRAEAVGATFAGAGLPLVVCLLLLVLLVATGLDVLTS